jgi:hypothetical protein
MNMKHSQKTLTQKNPGVLRQNCPSVILSITTLPHRLQWERIHASAARHWLRIARAVPQPLYVLRKWTLLSSVTAKTIPNTKQTNTGHVQNTNTHILNFMFLQPTKCTFPKLVH